MIKLRGFRWLAGPALLATLGAGCGPVADALPCDAGLSAKADALQGAVADLVKVSTDMKASLALACAGIAKDLGETPPEVGDGTKISDDVLTMTCDMATSAIKAKIAATSAIVVVVEGGKCEVNAQAQFDCETKCDVDGKCTPPTVELRCDPGELSGECDATCNASATCEGTASVVAQCEGTCKAACSGKCAGGACTGKCDHVDSSGACPGTCDGQCAGTCTGTCTGDCTLDATAQVKCGAMVSCRGGCSVAYKAPKCEGELKAPSCMIDADCEAGCKGQGSLEATCTPPKVVITGETTLQTTLQKNLPAVLNVLSQGTLVVDAATDVAGAADNVGTAITGSAACALKYGVSFATELTGAVAATASIKISIQASVSVNAATVPAG